MPDPGKKKKKLVQSPAGGNASRYVSTNSAAGKRIAKASKAQAIKKKGGRLLQSEKNAIKKSYSATKMKKHRGK